MDNTLTAVPTSEAAVPTSRASSRTSLAHRVDAELWPAPDRVISKLFLPGEELRPGRSRAAAVVERVLALPESEVEEVAAQLLRDFSGRHRDYEQMLQRHAAIVSSRVEGTVELSAARTLVIGAAFTAEFALEGAALCNPSAVPAPDQSGLESGQLRVAVSVRSIGEGHLSSIGFATAVIGPGPTWTFESRATPPEVGTPSIGRWRREHLRAVLVDQGRIDELAHSVLAALPESFTGSDLGRVLAEAQLDLLGRQGGPATADLLRQLAAAAYDVEFAADGELSGRTLMPAIAQENNGMEDARFVRFHTAADTPAGAAARVADGHSDSTAGGTGNSGGTVEYRATYTAYDGSHIAPRLLTSPDLRTFRARPLAGPSARNKGMALFPRAIRGRQYALCRSDGESTFIASSPDGVRWGKAQLVQQPEQAWETLQIGNCGPPIETPHGWLALTHGVGPMRVYQIGAVLLDLDEPWRMTKRLLTPLLTADADEREGYVPNVVYSCGGLVFDGRLWVPYGVGDARIAVAWADVDELIEAMTPVG